MQTGLVAAITAFEGLHKKLLGGIHSEKYRNYCGGKHLNSLMMAAKRAAQPGIIGLANYVSYTPGKDNFYMRAWEVVGQIEALAISPPREHARKIIKEKPADEKTIDELIKLYYEYKLISFHHAYLTGELNQ